MWPYLLARASRQLQCKQWRLSHRLQHCAVLQDLKAALRNKIELAECLILCSVGFQHVHELGWEWKVFQLFQTNYQLHRCPGWLPDGAAGSTATGAPAASALTGTAVQVPCLLEHPSTYACCARMRCAQNNLDVTACHALNALFPLS